VQKDPRFAEFAKGVLHGYHPTARFQDANIVQRPWSRQAKEGAKGSAVISIEYLGVSNAHYTLVVGVPRQAAGDQGGDPLGYRGRATLTRIASSMIGCKVK